MRRPLIYTVGIGILAVMAVGADTPPGDFQAELQDGTTITGKLVDPVLRLQVDFGVSELETRHIRRISFRPPDEESAYDVIELKDKSRLKGKLLQSRLTLEVDGEMKSLTAASLREMKAVGGKKAGLWAAILGLITLTLMEVVLGIDNVIFLAIVAAKLPPERQPAARRLGLMAALVTRLMLLASLSFLLGLTKPLFTLPALPMFEDLEAREVSLRDLILFVGGLFLIFKSVREMHEKLEKSKEKEHGASAPSKVASFGAVLVQIAILDIIFSLDSVITAVGMVDELWVMVTAMVIAMVVMMVFAGTISDYVTKHPTLKVLALAFLILIGVLLVAEGLGQHIDKGYIYFAMAFAVVVEVINIKLRH